MTSVKVMISLPAAMLEEIDRAAAATHRSRSAFLREAAAAYVAETERSRRPIDDPRVRKAFAEMDRLRDETGAVRVRDSVEVVRAIRDGRQ